MKILHLRPMIRPTTLVVALGLASLAFHFVSAAEDRAAAAIQLIVRADDMGVAQAANEACVRAYRDGIVRSAEVIVTGAWFPDAVRLLRAHPGLDVGVHLTWISCPDLP